MKNRIILAIILSIILIQSLVYADENFKTYLSKDRYAVGENVVINIEVTNPNPEESKIFWYISFTPSISKYSATLVGSASIPSQQSYKDVKSIEIEMPGEYTATVKFYDSKNNLLGEEILNFSAVDLDKTYLILVIAGAIVAILVIFTFYRKRSGK